MSPCRRPTGGSLLGGIILYLLRTCEGLDGDVVHVIDLIFSVAGGGRGLHLPVSPGAGKPKGDPACCFASWLRALAARVHLSVGDRREDRVALRADLVEDNLVPLPPGVGVADDPRHLARGEGMALGIRGKDLGDLPIQEPM